MRKSIKAITLLAVLCFFCAALWCRADSARAEEKLADGFYGVRRVAEKKEALLPLTGDEIIVKRSAMYLEPGDKPEYVVITKEHFAPLSLKESPEKMKDDTGRTNIWLNIKLTDDAAKKMEELTRANLGGRGTLVIKGESITIHKIRAVITDGKMVISRCSGDACEKLYVEFKSNVKGDTLDSLKWLSGHWAGNESGDRTEEYWMEPLGGVMPGMNRTVKKSGGVFYEYIRIEKTPEGIVYNASPMGKNLTAFPMVSLEKGKVIFENPRHDYPQRIIYQLDEKGALKARIEGVVNGKTESCEWIWNRVDSNRP